MDKKRIAKVLGLSTIIILSVVLAGSPTWSAGKQLKLMAAYFEPEHGSWPPVVEAWAEELEAVTNGQVTFKFAWGGSMGGPGEYHDLVSKGIVDVAPAVLAFGGPGRFPMIDAIALPYNIPKAVTGGRAMMAYWRKGHMDHELREIHPICFMTGHGDTLFTRDKGVETLADIKGLKINASTPLVQEKVRLWGGVPVAIPFTDLYTALQKQTIDGILLNWMVMELFKLNEVLNYATLPGQGTVCSGFIMNKKTYAKLPPEGKAFIKETADKYSDMFNTNWDKLCGAGRDRFLKTGGKELWWTDAALQKRAELEGPLWEKWIEDKEKRGLPGRKAVDDLYYILEGLGVKPTTVGYTPK